jgi:hypothetical protein
MTVLEFNTKVRDTRERAGVIEVDPEGLMNRLVAAGRTVLEVSWEDFGPLLLPVEDDVIFLVEAYEGLSSFIRDGGEHSVFLGDGELHMEATRDGDVVHVVCTHVPFLRRALLEKKEYEVNLESYVEAWTRLIHELIELGGPASDR